MPEKLNQVVAWPDGYFIWVEEFEHEGGWEGCCADKSDDYEYISIPTDVEEAGENAVHEYVHNYVHEGRASVSCGFIEVKDYRTTRKKKYSVLALSKMISVKTPRKIELPEGDITFEADDATTKLLMEQLFPTATEKRVPPEGQMWCPNCAGAGGLQFESGHCNPCNGLGTIDKGVMTRS